MKNTQMSPGQARVIDPILSSHARGYTNSEYIGGLIFPSVQVPARGAKVIRFGKESFRRANARRAPGASTVRVQYGYASDPISVVQEALEATVPWEIMEEADKVPGVDMASTSVDMVMDIMRLNVECECADLALDAASYDANHKVALAGTDRWSDYANSDPIKDVDEGREAVRRSIGRYPNTFTIGADVFNVLKEHPKITDRIKHTSDKSVTAEVLARLFNVERVVVGKAIYLPEDAADEDPGVDIWGGAAFLSWVPTAGGNYRVPSFGYCYELPGMPMVEEPYQERNIKSWCYPVTFERRPYLVGAEAGFLFQTPIG